MSSVVALVIVGMARRVVGVAGGGCWCGVVLEQFYRMK